MSGMANSARTPGTDGEVPRILADVGDEEEVRFLLGGRSHDALAGPDAQASGDHACRIPPRRRGPGCRPAREGRCPGSGNRRSAGAGARWRAQLLGVEDAEISATMGSSSPRSCPAAALVFTSSAGKTASTHRAAGPLPGGRGAGTLAGCSRNSCAFPSRSRTSRRSCPTAIPFLLVDRILEMEEDRRVLGVKNVSANERYFIAGPGAGRCCRPRSSPRRWRRPGPC